MHARNSAFVNALFAHTGTIANGQHSPQKPTKDRSQDLKKRKREEGRGKRGEGRSTCFNESPVDTKMLQLGGDVEPCDTRYTLAQPPEPSKMYQSLDVPSFTNVTLSP